jgi:guanylate kinase
LSSKATSDGEGGIGHAPPLQRRGLLLVLSSPSGAGKTTLARRLLETDPALSLSISVTTRKPRPGETEGRDYYFIDQAEFDRRRDGGDLIEWALVHGNCYATPRGPVEAAIAAGRDMLFDIDWQGAAQLHAALPDAVVRVFILPPSAAALKARLVTRAQDPPEVVQRRLAAASGEMARAVDYDYVIVNADLAASTAALQAILAAERTRRQRLVGLEALVATLRSGL